MKQLNYETISVGDTFTSKFLITEELVREYLTIFDDSHEINRKKEVPNYIFAIYYPIHSAVGKIAQGTIHLKQKMKHYADVYIGDELNVIVTIKQKNRKNERDYLVMEVNFLKDNTLVCQHETTHLWALT